MASDFPILFTGRELNFEVPKFSEMKSAADDLQIRLRQDQIDQKALQKEFRDNMNIDAAELISNYASDQQAKMAKAFTDKYTLEIQKNGGRVNDDILNRMQRDKNDMAMNQARWAQSQKLWARDKAMVEQAGGQALYDMDKFHADTQEFMRTGVYKPNSLEFSGVDMRALFNSAGWMGANPVIDTNTRTKNGYDIITTTTTPTADPKEAERYILQTILSNPRHLKGVQKEFQALPEKTKAKYLEGYDANGDGVIQPDEKTRNVNMASMNIVENPILRWAVSQDGYMPVVMQTKTSEPKMYKTAAATRSVSDGGETVNVEYEQDGKKIKTTLRGQQARDYLAANPPEAKRTSTEIIESSPMGKYTPPAPVDGAYVFDGLTAYPFTFERGAKGVDDAGGEIKADRFRKRHGALSVYSISPDGEVTLQATDGAMLKIGISQISNSGEIRRLRVNELGDGLTVRSIDEILSGGSNKNPRPY